MILSDEVWLKCSADVKLQAEKVFVQRVKKVAMEQFSVEEKKAKQVALEKKALEAAALLPKEEVLRRGLREVMSKKSGKFKYDALPHVVQFADILQLDVDPVPDKVERPPKNGSTPGGARGQNQGQAKAKAKDPKVKNNKGQPKGKSKGSGQQKNAGKEKGKGKGPPATNGPSKGKGKGGKPAQPQKGGRKGQEQKKNKSRG